MMIKYLPPNHPLNSVSSELLDRLNRAQSNILGVSFNTSGDLCDHVLKELHISIPVPKAFFDSPVNYLSNMHYRDLCILFKGILSEEKLPEPSIPLIAANISQRIQLVSTFEDPDDTLESVQDKVAEVVKSFPRKASDIQQGKNPGDVIDPYILAATQFLISGGNFEAAISATVVHKALMMIEGLLGHLHEDVIGLMRGNVRVPEPRGVDQENLDPKHNPFPGADVVQPPWSDSRPLKFHQIKSKSGSAKGGDGRRLGEQLDRLRRFYGGEIYYHALIGNTLRGHRSRAGVEKAAPGVVTLVGNESFKELTNSDNGAELLLRVYQTAFMNVAAREAYKLDEMVNGIVAVFNDRATSVGSGYLETILHDVINGPRTEQDSRLFTTSRRKMP